MGFFKKKNTRYLFFIMAGILLLSFIVSKFYYGNVNKSVDPRIVDARNLYDEYNSYAENNDFVAVLQLLDTVESMYEKHAHYRHSFEMGVLANNRAAVYITLALHKDSIRLDKKNRHFRKYRKDSLLTLAFSEITEAINIYESWKELFGQASKEKISGIIREEFYSGLEYYPTEEKEKFLKNRLSELIDTQTEIDRRLSVSYSNKGLIFRHNEDYKSAIACYAKALKLWERNLTAENNLNVLSGKPIKKRSFIQKLFPPRKND